MKRITYNDLFNRSVIINAIPLKGITGKPLCDIIMLRVDLGKAVAAFNSRMEEGLKKLKEEKYPKFDEESQKPEADRCGDYKGWYEELAKLYTEMRADAAAKEVEEKMPEVTREILTAFCEQGVDGDITLPGSTDASPNLMPKIAALHLLGEMVED